LEGKNKAAAAIQHTANAATIPPMTNQFGFFGAVNGIAGLVPEVGLTGAAYKAETFGKGDPQFEQTALLPGFSAPQLSHLTTFGKGGGACMTRPASRALPSVKSPPHWEQVSALAGLRVPQKGQWMSAPPCAAFICSSSVTSFCSDGSSNCTFSGWGAPQFSQVFTPPLLRVSQFGQVHSF
jgi:hypothetical protein